MFLESFHQVRRQKRAAWAHSYPNVQKLNLLRILFSTKGVAINYYSEVVEKAIHL
jgi:hypothetical protein